MNKTIFEQIIYESAKDLLKHDSGGFRSLLKDYINSSCTACEQEIIESLYSSFVFNYGVYEMFEVNILEITNVQLETEYLELIQKHKSFFKQGLKQALC